MGYVFRLWLNSNPFYISPRTRAAPARSTPLAITFISNHLTHCTMDTRVREHDGDVSLQHQNPTPVIPEVRHELSGIHLTINLTPKWILAFASMTILFTPSSYQKWATNYLVSISRLIHTQNGYPRSWIWVFFWSRSQWFIAQKLRSYGYHFK